MLLNDRIAFNAGSLRDSVIMPVPEWQACANPTRVLEVTTEAPRE